MRRVVAALLIPALLGLSGLATSLHTHVYEPHEHAEHQHGLAAHQHHRPPVDRHGEQPVVERCDPGQHAVAFTFVSTTPQHLHGVDATVIVASLTLPAPRVQRTVAPTEVRVHGPPQRAPASSRAPPSHPPA